MDPERMQCWMADKMVIILPSGIGIRKLLPVSNSIPPKILFFSAKFQWKMFMKFTYSLIQRR
jgi:hypothetical protein